MVEISLKDERKYLLAFSVCNGIGPVRFQKLYEYFGSAEKAWNASIEKIKACIGEKAARDVLDFKTKFNLDEYEDRMRRLQVSYLTVLDPDYPALLRKSTRPPIVLYKKGTYTFNENDILVSVVGTRKITEYGREVTGLLVSDLVRAGCVIVSGLAIGVDAASHLATLAAGGRTIAVLGSGVDVCTPKENSRLYDEILENGGAIVSEYPPGTMPNKGSFPARNRIIAGLSLGVLVTQGAEDSGSLITAHDAFLDNRKVFAVPGPITSAVSKGPIALIAKGAKIVTGAADIVDELGIRNQETGKPDKKNLAGLTVKEKKIAALLQDQKLHFDELLKRSGFSSSQLGTILSLMEMKGFIKSLDSSYFSLTAQR
jgi:DNA processing protein